MATQVTNEVTSRAGTIGKRGQAASVSHRELADGSDSWRVSWRNKPGLQPRQPVVTFPTAKGANWFASQVRNFGPATALAMLEARSNTVVKAPTLAEYMRFHVSKLRTPADISLGTRSKYLREIERDIATVSIGGFPMTVISKEMIEHWLDDHMLDERGLAPKSCATLLSLISASYQRAISDRTLDVQHNPAYKVSLPPAEGRQIVFLEPDDFVVLVKYLNPHYLPFIVALYSTGMRWGEATALRVGDLNLNANPAMIRVSRAWKNTDGHGRQAGPPKSEAANRYIGIPTSLTRHLLPLVRGRASDELVFVNEVGTVIGQPNFWRSVWDPAVTAFCAETGRRRPRVHDLRHSHASNLIKNGADLMLVQRRLGHAKISTTIDVYGSLARGAQGVAAELAEMSLSGVFPEIEA